MFCLSAIGQNLDSTKNYSFYLESIGKSLDSFKRNNCIIFRGDFRFCERYTIHQKGDSLNQFKFKIKGKGGYSYHYFTGLNDLFQKEDIESGLKIFQKKFFYDVGVIFRIPANDSNKNILFFEKVRTPKSNVPFDVKWISYDELLEIMWLDFCISRHYYKNRKIKIQCLTL